MKPYGMLIVMLGMDLISGAATSSALETNCGRYCFGASIKVNWFAANALCRQSGMELISITSQEKQNVIEKLIKDRGLYTDSFWTSGTRLGNGEGYYWMGNGRSFKYTNWQIDEPTKSNVIGAEESCVELKHNYRYRWNDRICSNPLFFICEREQIRNLTSNEMYYIEKVNKANWFMANRQCKQHGMDLVSIESKREQKKIERLLQDAGLWSQNSWTSGTRHITGIDYIWMGSGYTLSAYKNWYYNEPNGSIIGKEPEKCLEIMHYFDFKWNDRRCSEKLNFICERKPPIYSNNHQYNRGK